MVGGVLFFVLPFNLFVVMALASAASFYAHVYIGKCWLFGTSTRPNVRATQSINSVTVNGLFKVS